MSPPLDDTPQYSAAFSFHPDSFSLGFCTSHILLDSTESPIHLPLFLKTPLLKRCSPPLDQIIASLVSPVIRTLLTHLLLLSYCIFFEFVAGALLNAPDSMKGDSASAHCSTPFKCCGHHIQSFPCNLLGQRQSST